MNNASYRRLVTTVAAGLGIVASSAAMAHVNIGLNFGAPAAVVAPAPVYAQPVSTVVIAQGWHGDRYYDGHRYWAHDEWMRNHPRDRGPQDHRDHHQDDHRHDH